MERSEDHVDEIIGLLGRAIVGATGDWQHRQGHRDGSINVQEGEEEEASFGKDQSAKNTLNFELKFPSNFTQVQLFP